MENDVFNEFEERVYLDPTQSRNEQLSFIDTLRETQANNTAQINAGTYALGSQLPSNLGGLRGAEDTFVARYQTPQTSQTVANLRLAAQQSALNTALSNLQNAYKKRYNDAMLNYQKRATQSSTSGNGTQDDPYAGNVNVNTPDQYPVTDSIAGGQAGTMSVVNPDGTTSVYERNSDGSQGALLGTVANGQFTSAQGTTSGNNKVGALGGYNQHQISLPKSFAEWFQTKKRPVLGGGGW